MPIAVTSLTQPPCELTPRNSDGSKELTLTSAAPTAQPLTQHSGTDHLKIMSDHSEQITKSISDLTQTSEFIKRENVRELIRSISRQSIEMIPDDQMDIPYTTSVSNLSNQKTNHNGNNNNITVPNTSASHLNNSLTHTNINNHNTHAPTGINSISNEIKRPTGVNHIVTEKMSRTNLYIKGLCENFDDEQLWQLPPDQSKIKSVKAAIGEDTKCRGYGFIDFVSEEAANEALAHIKSENPSFTIKFAKENEKDKTNLYVTNLPKSWTTKDSDQLKTVFERFGSIQSAFVMMERLTNKSTGVGFVRFVNERDALNALDSLKNNPLILPECSSPVEAKFADKHNPETRRRRYPVNAVMPPPNYNSLINYSLYPSETTSLGSQDMLTSLINNALVSPSQTNHLSGLSSMNKSEFNHQTTGLLPTLIHPKHQSDTNNHLNLTELNGGRCNSTGESNLAALAAAASSLFSGNPNGYASDCLRSGHNCTPGNLNPSLNGTLLTANPVTLLTNSVINPTDAKLIDPSLCGCPSYGTDYFRSQQQQQQQQQLLSVAMAAMTNPTLQGCIYQSSADMNAFAAYHNLINSHTQNGLNMPDLTSCLNATDTGFNSLYANQANGLSVTHNPLQATISHLSDPMNSSRSENGLYQWVIPTHLIKNGSSEFRSTIPSTAISINHINHLVGLEKGKRHIQTYI